MTQKSAGLQMSDGSMRGLAAVLGLAGGAAAAGGLSSLLQSQGKAMGHTSPQRVAHLLNQVKNQYGLDVGYMHAPDIVGHNAAYAPAASVKPVADELEASGNKASVRAAAKLLDSARQHGIVLTGTHFKKPGTVEHELGHAISANKGNFVERFLGNNDVARYSTLYHGIPSLLLALHAAGKGGPLAGLLGGGIAGTLTAAPTLYEEYSANKYGDKLMDNSKPQHGKWTAFGTYLSNAAVPSMLSGGVYGLLKKYLKTT